MFRYPDVDEKIFNLGVETESELSDRFKAIDDISEANQYKVIQAFKENKVTESYFNSSSGYGYNDNGRDALERVYASVFHTEDALVRAQITCGTHAIYLALSANLLPGDELIYITGKPYDSLEMSIGITDSPLSLKEFGISFNYVNMINEETFDWDGIRNAINSKTKIIAIQRSKGYLNRSSLAAEYIGEAVKFVKSIKSDVIVFVDNCYGEFVQTKEPSDYGADLCVGSLIKNPGGGLAPIGGYIVGRHDLVERCAFKLTAPGLGREVGASLGILKLFYQGLSLAPKFVGEAMKNALFLARLYEKLGYHTTPHSDEERHCIVQAVDLKTPEKLTEFCRAIQRASYVDAFVAPEGSYMPGYADPVIMASGSFVSGSSLELSADGPMREPYTVFFQGGLTFEQGKYAVLTAASNTEN